MTSRDFCFWLQGYFELGKSPEGLSCAQVEQVKKHLALVFVHEIDPSAGPPSHQTELNEIHSPTIGGHAPGRPDVLYRC